jgi:CHAT domain-containing protein
VADPIDAGRTGIVFARPSGGEDEAGGTDGFLSVPEILALDLEADLTVLSACSGAVGETLPGGGLDSLAGALIESGSRAVIASLWDVGDAPTRTLVEQFYYGVGRGGRFSSSLREAKIALLRTGGEIGRPRHWAGWVLVGRGEGVAAPAFNPLLRTALPIACAALVAAVLWIRSRLRSSRRS